MVAAVKSMRSLVFLAVQDAASKNLLPTASFFGEKLVCLPGAEDEDIFVLAQLYFQQRQFKRALLTLQKVSNSSSPRFRLLAGQCLAEGKEWDQCLAVLGEEEQQSMRTEAAREEQEGVDTVAGMCLLRGKVYDMQQNRVKAAYWYQEAVKRDVRCYEAFEKLVDSHMLSAKQEEDLLRSLSFREEDLWLKVMYESRMQKYDLAVPKPLQITKQPSMQIVDEGAQQQASSVLTRSIDAMTIEAEFHYYHNDFQQAHNQTKAILDRDPFAHGCLAFHLSSLVELKLARELFIAAHRLVDGFADSAEAWYAVGCYYFLTKKYEQARRFFLKATNINNYFAPAWLGYGHTFAAQDESDQALAAYRTASRFFSGCHLPPLCIGMEYAKTGNLQVADQFFSHTLSICSFDPLVFNEIGVLRYLQRDYHEAARAFERVLQLSHDSVAPTWEATLFNLGHCYRKQLRFDEAAEVYQRALRCSPRNASTYTALGFTYHLKGDVDTAIDYYHKALGLAADDALTTEMLERALKDASSDASAFNL